MNKCWPDLWFDLLDPMAGVNHVEFHHQPVPSLHLPDPDDRGALGELKAMMGTWAKVAAYLEAMVK